MSPQRFRQIEELYHAAREASAEGRAALLARVDPIGALAHWRLGRAYRLSGDIPKARGAYEAFLSLWKDADRELAVLKQAQAEYAALK